MKLFLVFVLVSFNALANCHPREVRVWTQAKGYACVKRFHPDLKDCVLCQATLAQTKIGADWFANFPKALFSDKKDQPWWATQGNLHYPNLNYPGVWKKNGIDDSYYPGSGEVHALKPNIYVESVHNEKKFTFSFDSKTPLSFLSTTPPLDEKNTWRGKIVNKDRFEVDGINYDYLFYDIRLPKDKMQYERGVCAPREEAIKWMLKDLREMSYPAIALQDFEEHWKVKIPDYPYYCIYPQYNQQLDEILPVTINLEQVRLTRALFVMIPHIDEPDVENEVEPGEAPLPTLDSTEIRPTSVVRYENMFKEWGVAFLSN